MRNLILCAVMVSVSVSLSAQDYIISPSNDVWADIGQGSYEVLEIDMFHDNSSADSIQIHWEMLERQAPSPAEGWDYSYCDYNVCYLANVTSGTMKKIGPDQHAYFKVTLQAGSEGWGFFKLRIFKTGDEANADTLTYTFHSLLGLEDLNSGESVNLYPNPSDGESLTLSNVLPSSTVSIYNSFGQLVLSESAEETLIIDKANLNSGVYFIRLQRGGETYATKKLIVK